MAAGGWRNEDWRRRSLFRLDQILWWLPCGMATVGLAISAVILVGGVHTGLRLDLVIATAMVSIALIAIRLFMFPRMEPGQVGRKHAFLVALSMILVVLATAAIAAPSTNEASASKSPGANPSVASGGSGSQQGAPSQGSQSQSIPTIPEPPSGSGQAFSQDVASGLSIASDIANVVSDEAETGNDLRSFLLQNVAGPAATEFSKGAADAIMAWISRLPAKNGTAISQTECKQVKTVMFAAMKQDFAGLSGFTGNQSDSLSSTLGLALNREPALCAALDEHAIVQDAYLEGRLDQLADDLAATTTPIPGMTTTSTTSTTTSTSTTTTTTTTSTTTSTSTTTPGPAKGIAVQQDDSLWGIAAGLHPGWPDTMIEAWWMQLYELNRPQIGGNPSLIFPGTLLQIPKS